jgi:hypothetical protein
VISASAEVQRGAQTGRIFSWHGLLLVRRGEYSPDMAFYWSDGENILLPWPSIGQTGRIFSWHGPLLVRRGEYSPDMAFCWSDGENIVLTWPSIGRDQTEASASLAVTLQNGNHLFKTMGRSVHFRERSVHFRERSVHFRERSVHFRKIE